MTQQQFTSHILNPLLWRMASRYEQRKLGQSFAPHRSHTCCCALTIPVFISRDEHIPWLLLSETSWDFYSVIPVTWEKTCLSREFTAAQWWACQVEDKAQVRVTLFCNFTFSVWAILWYLGERKIGLYLSYLCRKCALHCCPILLVCIFLRKIPHGKPVL